jgi:hypothetical protein
MGETPCISTDKCINKKWDVHAVEYYSATKGSEALVHTTTWMNPENILVR